MWQRISDYWDIFMDFVDRYVLAVISDIKFLDIVDIVILAVILFYVYRFIRQRRAVRLARGLLIVLGVLLLSSVLNLRALSFILENFYQVGFIAIIVIFQSDLRAALERFGSTNIKNLRGFSESDTKAVVTMAETLSEAADALARTRTGALIVIERSTKLGEYLSHGVILNADMSSLLIRNVFYNKAPMHDGAMIIRNKRVYAAGCYLPLSQADVNKDLGTRHRAALGLSESSDALVIVVSEETGTISLAKDGNLERNYNYSSLKQALLKELLPSERASNEKQNVKKKRGKKTKKEESKDE